MKYFLPVFALSLLLTALHPEGGHAEDGRYQVKVSWYEPAKGGTGKMANANGVFPSGQPSDSKNSAEAQMRKFGGEQVLQAVLPLCRDRSVEVDTRQPYPFEGPGKGSPGEGWKGTVSWMKTEGDRLTLKINFGVYTLTGDKTQPTVSQKSSGSTYELSLGEENLVAVEDLGLIVELHKAVPGPELGWDLYEVPISKDGPKIGGIGPLTGEDSLISQMKLNDAEKFGSLRIPLVKGAKVTVTGLPGEDGKPMDNIPSGTVRWIPLPNPKIYRLEMEVWLQKIIAGDEVSRRSIDKTTIELQEGYGMAMGGLIAKDSGIAFIVGVTPAQP